MHMNASRCLRLRSYLPVFDLEALCGNRLFVRRQVGGGGNRSEVDVGGEWKEIWTFGR
jgi:hypothetical protein